MLNDRQSKRALIGQIATAMKVGPVNGAKSILATYRGFCQLGDISGEIFKLCGDIVQESVDEFGSANDLDGSPDLKLIKILAEQADVLDESVRKARSSFEDFLGLVKTFSSNEFGTIYYERECRSLSRFEFTHEDVAMIVMPRTVGTTDYYQPFCQSVAPSLHLSATVSIVPWEDLIEH